MPALGTPTQPRISGHLQVRDGVTGRRYLAIYNDRNGAKRTLVLGPAHIKDSGRRTPRGAVIWRAASGPCPAGAFTPKAAADELAALLEEERHAPRVEPRPVVPDSDVPTFGHAVTIWLEYLEHEKRRKESTLQDARNTATRHLLPHFGAERPLYVEDRYEVVVRRNGRQSTEWRSDRRDTITTEDVDEFRRTLLASHLSPRSVQKILVLLHGCLKLAARRKLISVNPCADAERVVLIDSGVFSILEPIEFEAVYRAVIAGDDEEDDSLSGCEPSERLMLGAALSIAFYAGLRIGEIRDLPWRNIDFTRSLIRVESGYTHARRSTPKNQRARTVPLLPDVAQRLAVVAGREFFSGPDDYVVINTIGRRIDDGALRSAFYDGLARAGLGSRRDDVDRVGNPQKPMVFHDLRHSYCSWAVNVWPVPKVKEFAGHRDIQVTMRYVHSITKEGDAAEAAEYLARVTGPQATVVHDA